MFRTRVLFRPSPTITEIAEKVRKDLLKTESVSSKKKKKNFYDLAFQLPRLGEGMRFIRNIWWNKPETYWTVTKVYPKLKGTDKQIKRGKAFGIFTFKGVTESKPRKIRATVKGGWRYVPEEDKHVHWPLGARKDTDMNHPRYPQHLKEKYYDLV